MAEELKERLARTKISIKSRSQPYPVLSRPRDPNKSIQAEQRVSVSRTHRGHKQIENAPIQNAPSTVSSEKETIDEICLTIVESYNVQLKTVKDSIFIRPNLLVLNDFDLDRKILNKQKYVIVQRQAKVFHNGHRQWIYWCSCNANNSKEFSSLSANITMTYAEFQKIYPMCLHIKISQKFYDIFDADNDIEPDEYQSDANDNIVTDDEHNYSRSPEILVVGDNILCLSKESYGLLNNKMECLTCARSCGHPKVLQTITKNEEHPLYETVINFCNADEKVHKKSGRPIKCLSYEKIDYNRTEALATGLRNLQEIQSHLVPAEGSCRSCGGDLVVGNPIENSWIAYTDSLVVTNTSKKYVNVYYRPCTRCASVTVFEGRSHCLLNMGSYLIGHDVLRSYLHSFLHGRRPIYTFYQTFLDVHSDYGNTELGKELTYTKFLNAWHSYLRLLNTDFSTNFSCPQCGNEPDTIICDGTSLAFQRRMWQWKNLDKQGCVKDLTNATFRDRLLIPDPHIRTLLKRYSVSGKFHPKQNKLDQNEMKKLLQGILLFSEPLYKILLEIEENPGLLHIYQKLLFCLASPSPVSALLWPSKEVECLVTNVMQGIDIKENPMLWSSLHDKAPIFFDIFHKTTISDNMKTLMYQIWNKSISIFVHSQPDIEEDLCTTHPDDELSHFPNLPKYRQRGLFKADMINEREKEKEKAHCKKKGVGHPSLLPGVFTIFCPHGVCYGFQVMENNESPNVPFTILRTRFKTAPKHVVYDNACKLHQYCLNRDPLFFKRTIFFVDRLHWDNHSSCSYGYELARYPEFEFLNSQCNEQANSGLKRIKDQLSYMTASNFMTHCTLYMQNLNKKKIDHLMNSHI